MDHPAEARTIEHRQVLAANHQIRLFFEEACEGVATVWGRNHIEVGGGQNAHGTLELQRVAVGNEDLGAHRLRTRRHYTQRARKGDGIAERSALR